MNANVLNATSTLSIAASSRPTTPDGPTVVITLPFEPKMNPKQEIETALKDIQTRAVRQLMAQYSRDTALPVIDHLQQLIFDLNFNTHKKSVVLLVSPETQHVLYLDQPVPNQVLINHPFRIRDLTLSPDSPPRYLVLLLTGRLSKMYASKTDGLQLIKDNVCPPMEPCAKDDSERGEPCGNVCVRKNDLLDTFLRHMDQGLSSILDACDLPVFVIAHDSIARKFADITRNDRHIAAYIHQNHIQSGEKDLLAVLQPYLANWHKVLQEIALKQVAFARHAGKLSCGIEAVTKAAGSQNNRLLLIEKGFNELNTDKKKPFFITDAVDAIIELVLEHGGQVQWTDKGQLEKENHIALIRYY